VVSQYRGYTVYGMGPPSSGGSTVAEVLNIMGGYNPAGSSRIQVLHRMLEASRYAFADRGAYLADPAYFAVPLKGLLSATFADERRALIGDTAAKSPVAPGNPYDDQGSQQPGAAKASADISHPNQSTTHLTVVDAKGTMVSYTFTIESIGGNAVTVPGYGFLLNNELTDFDYDSTTKANRADSGKRPRSSMSPTIITKNGKPFLAVGSPGGSTIIGTVLQTIVNRLDLHEPLPNAIALPRAVERNTATAQAEQSFIDSSEGQALIALGHKFAPPPAPGEIGATTGIEVHGKRLTAAAEPQRRGTGSAAVVTPSP
jgi:gamma-glutamyltranspeptidase/glutathione hydrolase